MLIFFNSIGWLGWPKKIFYSVAAPIARPFVAAGIKISDVFGATFNLKSIIRESSQLEQENRELILKLVNLSEIKQENDFLRKQLDMRPALKSKLVLAHLIGFDPGNLGRYFLIDRGSNDGIETGRAVIFAGGFLVGKVAEVSVNSSKVLALTDSDSTVFVLGQDSREGGVIKGDHGVGLILDMVPPEKEIKLGELIVSSGLDSKIVRGLVIGKVEKKISGESEVFQRFIVKPLINYKEIESVLVILGAE